MKALKIIIFFIVVLTGCSNKYVAAREEGLIDREWSVLDAKIVGKDNVGFTLNLNVQDFVEVKDSVKLRKLFESRRRKVGFYKVLGGCAIAGCAALASAGSVLSWANNPSDDIFLKLAWGYGIVGGIGALYFIISGSSDFAKSNREKPYYTKKNIMCKNSIPLRDEEVEIMLEKTDFGKIYYTDENGNIELKMNEIIPEPTEADSTINLIIQYEEMVDTLDVRLR